jgi:hypothetical protein
VNVPAPTRTEARSTSAYTGVPYAASAITLYSSDEGRKPRCSVASSYIRPSELGRSTVESTSSSVPRACPARNEPRSPRPSTTIVAERSNGAAK